MIDATIAHLYALFAANNETAKQAIIGISNASTASYSSAEYMSSATSIINESADLSICQVFDSESSDSSAAETMVTTDAVNQRNDDVVNKELLVKLLDTVEIVKDCT